MGKETKIGLAVIFILLVVFGVVLFNRMNGTSEDPAAAVADGETKAGSNDNEQSSGKETEGTDSPAGSSEASTVAADQYASADLNQWSGVSQEGETTSGVGQSPAVSSPPSFMPKPVTADSAGRYGGYGGMQTAPGTSDTRQGSPGDPAGSTPGQPAYDPFPQQTAQGGPYLPANPANPVRQGVEAYNSPTQQNPLRAADDTAGSTGDPGATSQHSGNSGYNSGPGYYTQDSGSPPQTPAYSEPQTPGYSDSSHSTYRAAPALPKLTGQYSSEPARGENGTYIVQPNENYWAISQKLYGTGAYFQALSQHNRSKVPEPDRLQVGDEILAPEASDLEAAYPDLCPKPSHRAAAAHRTSTVSTPSLLGGGHVYVVQQGDTLFDIAHFELGKASRWTEIVELNKESLGPDLEHLNYLTPGMKLALPNDEPADTVTRRPGSTFQR